MSGTSAWSVCKMWAVFSESEMYREKEDVEIAVETEDADTKDRLAHGAVGPASCMGPRSGSESMTIETDVQCTGEAPCPKF